MCSMMASVVWAVLTSNIVLLDEDSNGGEQVQRSRALEQARVKMTAVLLQSLTREIRQRQIECKLLEIRDNELRACEQRRTQTNGHVSPRAVITTR